MSTEVWVQNLDRSLALTSMSERWRVNASVDGERALNSSLVLQELQKEVCIVLHVCLERLPGKTSMKTEDEQNIPNKGRHSSCSFTLLYFLTEIHSGRRPLYSIKFIIRVTWQTVITTTLTHWWPWIPLILEQRRVNSFRDSYLSIQMLSRDSNTDGFYWMLLEGLSSTFW